MTYIQHVFGWFLIVPTQTPVLSMQGHLLQLDLQASSGKLDVFISGLGGE